MLPQTRADHVFATAYGALEAGIALTIEQIGQVHILESWQAGQSVYQRRRCLSLWCMLILVVLLQLVNAAKSSGMEWINIDRVAVRLMERNAAYISEQKQHSPGRNCCLACVLL